MHNTLYKQDVITPDLFSKQIPLIEQILKQYVSKSENIFKHGDDRFWKQEMEP